MYPVVTSTAMGMVITSEAVEVTVEVVGLTRTILLEVMGLLTTIEDGLFTTVDTTFDVELGCNRITDLAVWPCEVVIIWWCLGAALVVSVYIIVL